MDIRSWHSSSFLETSSHIWNFMSVWKVSLFSFHNWDMGLQKTRTTPLLYTIVFLFLGTYCVWYLTEWRKWCLNLNSKDRQKCVGKARKRFIFNRQSRGTEVRKITAGLGIEVCLGWLKWQKGVSWGKGRSIKEGRVTKVEDEVSRS